MIDFRLMPYHERTPEEARAVCLKEIAFTTLVDVSIENMTVHLTA